MKKIIKENYKFIISLVLIFLILNIRFPYYIDAPGGITDISKKVQIDGYKSTGTFNLAYVNEYKATIPTLLFSLINKDWNILKTDQVLLDTEDDKTYSIRDKVLMQESISDAIYVAYTKSNSNINILSNKLIVTYLSSKSNTNLVVGDEIIYLNNKKVSSKKDITNIIDSLNIGDRLDLIVINNNKKYNRYAYIVNDNGIKKIGILISNIREYETSPKVTVNVDKDESGSSGGLITALYIYNSLTKEDITKGLTIVGTGTIDDEGNVGSIGGVEYKLKSAVKSKADLFIVPNDKNYSEALKLKNENNYKIEILGVSTFDDVINYLKNVS
jgi:PDZ domain-containing protein